MIYSRMLRILFLIPVLITTGCAPIKNMIPSNWGKEEGEVWCSNRYLDMNEYYQHPETSGAAFRKRLALSEKGYLYSLAAAYTLQSPKSDKYNFRLPSYMTKIDSLSRNDKSGFQAETFIIINPSTGNKNVVVAFRGTDQFKDWYKHNAWLWPNQFEPARNYIKDVVAHPESNGLDLIVSGYSLGGGLAVHVAQHPDTRGYVIEAWALNPSPRTGVPREEDKRIYMLTAEDEVLNILRRASIGAPINQNAEDFDLLSSSSWYAHSRWVLTRQIMIYADLSLYIKSGRTAESTPPLDILKSKKFVGCRAEDEARTEARRKKYRFVPRSVDTTI